MKTFNISLLCTAQTLIFCLAKVESFTEQKIEQMLYQIIIKVYGEEDRIDFIPDHYQSLWSRRPNKFYTRSLSKFMLRKTEQISYWIIIKIYGEEDQTDFIPDQYQNFWRGSLLDRADFILDHYQNLWRGRPSRFYTRSISKLMERKTK